MGWNFAARVIIKGAISRFHGSHNLSGLIVSNSIPFVLAVGKISKIFNGKLVRFRPSQKVARFLKKPISD
jgi:hypothetical protein